MPCNPVFAASLFQKLKREGLSTKMASASGHKGDFDVQLKLLLIGDGSVGKSSLLARYTDDTFSAQWISTIGIDFKTKVVELDGLRVRCQIWDTAGQERFRTITTSFFRGAQGIALCFDVTSLPSFNNIGMWMQQVMESADQGVRLMLVGTKVDLPGAVVSLEDAKALAKKHSTPDRSIEVFFTSAKANVKVKEAFESLTSVALQHYLVSQPAIRAKTNTVKLAEAAKAEGKSGCSC